MANEIMQERQWDETDKLTDNVGIKELFGAVLKPENKMVALHKPGSKVKMSDGKEYIVTETGAWKLLPIDPPLASVLGRINN